MCKPTIFMSKSMFFFSLLNDLFARVCECKWFLGTRILSYSEPLFSLQLHAKWFQSNFYCLNSESFQVIAWKWVNSKIRTIWRYAAFKGDLNAIFRHSWIFIANSFASMEKFVWDIFKMWFSFRELPVIQLYWTNDILSFHFSSFYLSKNIAFALLFSPIFRSNEGYQMNFKSKYI